LPRDRILWEWSSTRISRHRRLRQGRDFLATAAVVRSTLGISPSAWEAAQTDMGEVPAAVVACILQSGAEINSAGGYLRGLTRKSEFGDFSLGPILMAQINSRRRNKKRA
jgi:replication initiation protein RepC